MDILFVDAFKQSSLTYFPLGINLLSTIIETNSNYASEVISFPNLLAEKKISDNILLEDNFETIVQYLINKKPKIISFYTIGDSYFISLTVAKNIKKIDKDIKIIFAGPHVSLCSRETLEAFDFIDLIAIGEGEKNIIRIMDYFHNKEKIENIQGICYRKSNQLVCNEAQPLIENLDELPMLELSKESYPTVIPIEAGRGCPFNCTFCCTKTFWKRNVRFKSIARLIEEIRYYMIKYNVNQFDFIHDLFTANKKYILEFCQKIYDLKIDIEWSCSARADSLDGEIIGLMAQAGCKKVLLGIETGSQRMQKMINKNLNMSEVKTTSKLLKLYNIEMQVSFIYGFPTEDEADLLQTLNLIRFFVEKMLLQEVTINKCICFPGTQIYFTQKNNLIFNEENLSLFNYCAKKHVDFIKKYPNLFSGSFLIDNQLIDKYFYLDIFINYIYNFFAFRTPKTLNGILQYYNDNLLDFYLEYEIEVKRFTSLLTRTIYYEDKLSSVREEMFDSLGFFIEQKLADEFLAQLFQFEQEIMKISLNINDIKTKALIFDYDMLLYYQESKKQKDKCRLILTVTENQEIKIEKDLDNSL